MILPHLRITSYGVPFKYQYDNMEDYDTGSVATQIYQYIGITASLQSLNGGYQWPDGYKAIPTLVNYDDMESYTSGSNISGSFDKINAGNWISNSFYSLN